MPERTLFQKSTILVPGLTRILFNIFKSNKKMYGSMKTIMNNVHKIGTLNIEEKKAFIKNYKTIGTIKN